MRDEDLKYIMIDFQARDRATGELMGQEVMKVHVDKLKSFFQENGMEAPLFRRVSSQASQSSSTEAESSPPPVGNINPKDERKKKEGGSSSSDPKKWTMKSWRPVPPAEISNLSANSSGSVGAASQLSQEEGTGMVAGPSDNFCDRSMSPPTLSPVQGSSPKKIRLRKSKCAVLSPKINVADPAVMEQEEDDTPPPAIAGPSSRPCPPAAAPESQRNGRKKRGRRGWSGNNFPNLKDPAVPLCTPPPARTKAKVVGVSAVPLNGWEKELKNKPVILEELSKLPTEWGVIIADEPVYARWSDNKYYSGVVKEKGDNDTWIIEFDDSIEAPASKSHILPIRVLGVGVRGVYTPDQVFEAKEAEIIGQKFDEDYEDGTTYIKYAIKIVGENEPTWCSRRQLAIKGKEGMKLRKSVKIEVADKGGDVSLDNIVLNRRRGRKPPPENERKKVEKSPKARERLRKGGKAKKVEGKDENAAATTLPKISPPDAILTMCVSTQQPLPSTSSKLHQSVSGPPPAEPPPPPSSVAVDEKMRGNCEKIKVSDDSSEDELLDIPVLTSECRRTISAAPRPCVAVSARVRPSGLAQQVAVAKRVGKTQGLNETVGKKVEQKENLTDKKEEGEECMKKNQVEGKLNGNVQNQKDKDAVLKDNDDDNEEDDGIMGNEDKLEITENNEDEGIEAIEEDEDDDEGRLEIVEDVEEEIESVEEEENGHKPQEPIGIEEEDENNNGTDEGDENEIETDDIFETNGANEDGGDGNGTVPKSVDQSNGGDNQESMDEEGDSDDPIDEDLDEMEVDESSSSSSTKEIIAKVNAAPPFLKYNGGERDEKQKGLKGKTRESPPMPNIIIPLEPTPKPVKCFAGYQFYITSCDRQDKFVPSKVYEKYHTGSFNKETLIKMIEHGGGKVLGKIGSETYDKEKTPFIISNCFSRTAEYLYGVAACYPCVDRKWIAKCLEQQKFLYWSNFTLPTGWSMEEKRVIMPHYKKPLEKKRIFMAPEHKYAEWGPIAKVGGCLNMNDIQIGPGKLLPPKVGIVIILDEEMENFKAVISEADKRHVRVVKHEWLVQTVITGKLAPFHVPKYCILDQKTVTTEVKEDPYLDGLVTVSPPPRPSSRMSEESLLSVGGV